MVEKSVSDGEVAQNTLIQILVITTIAGFEGVIILLSVMIFGLNPVYDALNIILVVLIPILIIGLGVLLWQRRQGPYMTTQNTRQNVPPLEEIRTSEELLKILIEDNRKNSKDNKAYFLFQLINPIIALGAMVLAIYSSSCQENNQYMFGILVMVVFAEIFVIYLSVTSGKLK